MNGTLYGVGVGPGDPRLMTYLAVDTIKNCPVIAVPADGKEKAVAYKIASGIVDGIDEKECLNLSTPMTKDKAVLDAAYQAAAEAIIEKLREGKDVAIIATGLCVNSALEAAEKLAADGIQAKVVNIHTIKPLDEELVVAAAKECGKVVTVEEHSVIGGLGGAVCEVLSEKYPVPVKRIGVNDVYGESGPAVKLIEKYGLDGKGVYASVKEFVK